MSHKKAFHSSHKGERKNFGGDDTFVVVRKRVRTEYKRIVAYGIKGKYAIPTQGPEWKTTFRPISIGTRFYPTDTVYSDHILLANEMPISVGHHEIRVGTFNAMLSVIAHRGYENLYNDDSSQQWKGMSTGDEFPVDQERREFVTNYIFEELESIDFLAIQEIDVKSIDLLIARGVKVAYSQEAEFSNRGGCAICTLRPDVTFSDTEAVFDFWVGEYGPGKKHIGTYTVVNFADGCQISLSSFHFDKFTHPSAVLPYVRHETSFVGGDFNKDVKECIGERITEVDSCRCEKGFDTIDAVFRLSCDGLPVPLAVIPEGIVLEPRIINNTI